MPYKYLIVLLILLNLLSCSSKQKNNISDYQNAMNELKKGNFTKSAELFESIDDKHFFTEDAVNGLIMSSYAYHKAKNYDDSNRVIDYFLQSNPLNENKDYLLYLKSLNYFYRIKYPTKSKDIILLARSSLKELIENYPNSIYLESAKEKLNKTELLLAQNKMNLGNYYFKIKNYMAAMNHYNNILEDHKNTILLKDAISQLIQITDILELKYDNIRYKELHNYLLNNN